jgi:hypothetical protein
MSDITQKPQGVAVKPKMFARKLLGVKSDIADGNSNLNLTTAVALRWGEGYKWLTLRTLLHAASALVLASTLAERTT